jgi:hypothetical protein
LIGLVPVLAAEVAEPKAGAGHPHLEPLSLLAN